MGIVVLVIKNKNNSHKQFQNIIMKTPKVVYKIQRQNFENPLEITLNIEDVESRGLTDYLYQNGLIDSLDDHFEVLNRFVVLPPKETKKPFAKNFDGRSGKKFNGEFKKQDLFPLREFRVHLYSNEYFASRSDIPEYVDVKASTKGRAIMIAMNKVGYTDFPENWGNIQAVPGHQISDWGTYVLDDSNNAYLKKNQNYISPEA